jgi:hypothetical protein
MLQSIWPITNIRHMVNLDKIFFFFWQCQVVIDGQDLWATGKYSHKTLRSGIECLKRNRKNSHQQPLPGSLGKTGRAKADVNIPLIQ